MAGAYIGDSVRRQALTLADGDLDEFRAGWRRSATTRASRGSRRARTAPPSSAPTSFFSGYEGSLKACDLG